MTTCPRCQFVSDSDVFLRSTLPLNGLEVTMRTLLPQEQEDNQAKCLDRSPIDFAVPQRASARPEHNRRRS
jgi:hypothetical protein